MIQIFLDEPVISADTVTWSWRTEPSTSLYRRTSFSLRFPEATFPAGTDARDVPMGLWWRLGLMCLYPHWVLLRPCQVVLPVRLAPGEAEFWLRLCDAATWTLEARVAGDRTERGVEIVESGPHLPVPLPESAVRRGTVACFSGGRDSLAQLGLLQELGEPTILVTTRSPREGSVEHDSARRDQVMRDVVVRSGAELLEVTSDFRSAIHNGFAGDRYGMAVTELTDCLLYVAAAVAVAYVRGADHVAMASEYEVHATQRLGGLIVQHPHFMYSAVTHRALSTITAPWGITIGGLTAPLHQFQVQRVLALRYPTLRDLQYSCWEMSADQAACSVCAECIRIAMYLLADGVDPAVASIDLLALLKSDPPWRTPDPDRPFSGPGWELRDQSRRLRQWQFSVIDPEFVRECVAGDPDAVATFEALRAQALTGVAESLTQPGYCAEYLDLIDERWRSRLQTIYGQYFTPDTAGTGVEGLARITQLSAWITAPLDLSEPVTAPRRHDPMPRFGIGFNAPTPLDAVERSRVEASLPDPEPALAVPATGTPLRVADTDLGGNERAYLTACLDDNFVSSAGPFVPRFEQAFADLAGTRHAVACSSGTTALQLAYAAAGVGPGDQVIMPTFTMIATANAATHLGAEPVFVDTDPDTWNLSYDAVAQAVTRRTRAIVLVHTYGRPVDAAPFRELADRNGLALIEDAAEAHGARVRGRAVGSLGHAAAFSFYGNKILTTGEGGMVTTDDARIAATAREFRDHGFSSERHFWHRLRAFNFRMTNLQAALGVAQVERAHELIEARAELGRRYEQAIGAIPGVAVAPPLAEGLAGVTWMYGIRITPEFPASRDDVRRGLAAAGIETRTFFVPLHLQPAYLRTVRGRFPVAERLGQEGLYLPSGSSVTESDVSRVAEVLAGLGAMSSSSA